ncbi:LppX_LprAFG lipoprotein [Microtetraspora malaysiensis]|uniref:LppX_LprAFG lipoprotein n=1 Tax=Microtetraspora malaysiensis TaxID=161358 RepID=UPI000B0ED87E|nr:LppX_LprAFG lipoprotein [Microtetraspora malaysiensis]
MTRLLTRRLAGTVWLVLAVLLVPACGGSAEAGLPAGPDLMKKAATAMAAVETVAFTIETEGNPSVTVKHAEGSLTKEGDAKGTLQIDIMGSLQELEFVLLGDAVHFKGPTGGFQRMTREELAALYDPSAVLTGLPALLSGAVDARTEAVEKVAGTDAYRVPVTLSQQILAKLIPGIAQGVNGTVWLDKATGRLLKMDLPLTGGKVVVNLSDYDAPVTITPPAS